MSLSADDGAGSGDVTVHYTVEGVVQKTYTGPFTISDLGLHKVTYWSVDKAGNQEQVRYGYVNIAVFYAKAEGLAPDQVSEWHNGPWAVTLTAGGTPPSTLCYRVDGGGWQLDQVSPVTLDFPGAGHHRVDFYAKNAGGTSEPQTGYVNIDVVKPVTKLATPAPTRWVRRDVKLTYLATDDHAGIEATYSKVNGATPVAGAGLLLPAPLTHLGDGIFKVLYWSVDRAGNIETPKSATVRIDTVRPTVSAGYRASVVRYGTAKLRFAVKDKTLYRYGVKAAARIVVKNSHGHVVKTIKKSVKTGVDVDRLVPLHAREGDVQVLRARDRSSRQQAGQVASNRLTVR